VRNYHVVSQKADRTTARWPHGNCWFAACC